MFCTRIYLPVLCLLFFSCQSLSQTNNTKYFRVVPLGVKGGIDESNLSAYMIATAGTNRYVCLDAGTLYFGVEKAINNKVFDVSPEEVIKKYIKGYFISHAHLDHIAGLIINSPADTSKNIYGLQGCIETIEKDYFTWQSWANFGDAGQAPLLKKYHYEILRPGTPVAVANTSITVTPFVLSHSNIESTAFLLHSNNAYILYLGDTGADEIEKSHHLDSLWQAIAPLIKNKHLKAIMIEASFPDEQPDKTLFGHLTPHWLMKEMDYLAAYTGKQAIKGMKIIVTHAKPPQTAIDRIRVQLNKQNALELNLIFPQQGKPIDL